MYTYDCTLLICWFNCNLNIQNSYEKMVWFGWFPWWHWRILSFFFFFFSWNILESCLLLRKNVCLGKDILSDICCVLRRAPVSVAGMGPVPPCFSITVFTIGAPVCVKEVVTLPPSRPSAGEHSRAIPMQTHFGLV